MATFEDGLLTISSDADDVIAVVASTERGGRVVKINGADPTGGPLPTGAVRHLQVIGGPGENTIDLRGVGPASFPNLGGVSVRADDGKDMIFGSRFADHLDGGAGDNCLVGGPGDDVYLGRADGPVSEVTIFEQPGEGRDTLVIGAAAPVTFTFDPGHGGRQVVSAALAVSAPWAGTVEQTVVRRTLPDTYPYPYAISELFNPAIVRFDARGVIQVISPYSAGWYHNPTTVAMYVNVLYRNWVGGDVGAYSALKANAEWLRDHAEEVRDAAGGTFLIYRFPFAYGAFGAPAGWRSALTAAMASVALTIASHVLDDPSFAARVPGLLGGFDRLIRDGGYRISLAPGADWYEEYADPAMTITPRVLNGHMYALTALDWLARSAGVPAAADLFQAGVNGLRQTLSLYDVEPLSLYDVYRRNQWRTYHEVHSILLHHLFSLTGVADFRRYADAWAARTWDGTTRGLLPLPAPNTAPRAEFEVGVEDRLRRDAKGVLQTFAPRVGWYYEPGAIAKYALALYQTWRGGDDSALPPLLANALWLRDNIVRQTYGGGKALYTYPVPAPNVERGLSAGWRSAETAAGAAAALYLVGRIQQFNVGYDAADRFFGAAARLMTGFNALVTQGGYAIAVRGTSALWFESAAAPRARVMVTDLDGHLRTIALLRWYARNSGNETALRLVMAGTNGLSVVLSQYDLPPRSIAALTGPAKDPQTVADRVRMLLDLFAATGVKKFKLYADRWAAGR